MRLPQRRRHRMVHNQLERVKLYVRELLVSGACELANLPLRRFRFRVARTLCSFRMNAAPHFLFLVITCSFDEADFVKSHIT